MSARPRLCLDISPLLEDQWTGIPVFARRLVTSLVQSQKVDLEYAVSLTKIPTARVEDTIRCGFGTFLRTEVSRTGFSGLGKVDPSVPLLYPSVKLSFGLSGQEASVVHDMSTLVMPETHAPANVAHHMDPLCDELATDETVFCVSEATRQALQLAFPSVRGRTRVLYQYADWPEEFDLIDRNMPQLALPPFAAVVGTIEPRKNLNLLLRALEHPDVMATDMSFVIIGKRGWRLDEALAGLSDTARNRLIFTGFVSEFIKYRLLKAAQFLIFPSIYEGFGIPAVEAMSLGKPVLASLTSSFPEVIGDAGLFFDPYSVDEFAAGLREISDARKLQELAPVAIKQAASFSPERMAEPVLEWLEA